MSLTKSSRASFAWQTESSPTESSDCCQIVCRDEELCCFRKPPSQIPLTDFAGVFPMDQLQPPPDRVQDNLPRPPVKIILSPIILTQQAKAALHSTHDEDSGKSHMK